MRYLLTSFCFIWLFSACNSYPKKQHFKISDTSVKRITNPFFSDTVQDYVYKAHIDVYDNSFGGLLIIKKLNEQHHRIAFTTEMGNKIFDFSFDNNDFKVNYILEDIDNVFLINILKQDFSVLIKEHIPVNTTYQTNKNIVLETEINNKNHYYYMTGDTLNKVVRANNGKEKVLFLFSEISDSIAKHVQIIHHNIKLKINLKSIR